MCNCVHFKIKELYDKATFVIISPTSINEKERIYISLLYKKILDIFFKNFLWGRLFEANFQNQNLIFSGGELTLGINYYFRKKDFSKLYINIF